MSWFSHGLTVFLGFFAIMNPIANTPIFLGLTQGDDPQTMRKVALKAMLLAFVIVVIFCVLGKVIFTLFGITLPAFRIAGGILVFMIGYQMLHGEHSASHMPSPEDKEKALQAQLSVAISPLAVPLLAGSGTIATAMNYLSERGLTDIMVTIVAFGILCVITYFMFISGQRLVQFLGQNAVNAISRLMGLLLAVIGVQMLISGVGGAVTFLGVSG